MDRSNQFALNRNYAFALGDTFNVYVSFDTPSVGGLMAFVDANGTPVAPGMGDPGTNIGLPGPISPLSLVYQLLIEQDGIAMLFRIGGASMASAEGGEFGNGDGTLTATGYTDPIFCQAYPFPPLYGTDMLWLQQTQATYRYPSSGGGWPTATGFYKVTILATGFSFSDFTPVCYRGDSFIKFLNPITNLPEEKQAKDITNSDLVFSVSQNKFVPVRLNIVTYNNKKYYIVKKNSLGENKPFQDLYITGGHPILYNNKETPVMLINDTNSVDTVDCKPEEVYSICTDKREYILVNNIEALTWSYDAWRNAILTSHKISWTDNGKNCTLEQPKIELLGDDTIEPKNIKICKDSCGPNIPSADMDVNENYKVLVDGNEKTIFELLNGGGIKWNQ